MLIYKIIVFGVSENPQVIEKRPLHSEKVTLCSEGVIGPYYYENGNGMTVTINSERYGQMIINFFFTYY